MTLDPWNKVIRVETYRSGIFKFQAGVDVAALQPLIDRVEDAHKRFVKTPLLPGIIDKLDNRVIVTGVHGTDSIEDGNMSTRAVEEALALPPDQVKEENQRRIQNTSKAYLLAGVRGRSISEKFSSEEHVSLSINEEMFTGPHKVLMDGLQTKGTPGEYRKDQKDHQTTIVGHEKLGGAYVPPKSFEDITRLMTKLIEWANSDSICSLSPLIRAPLVHIYFELIHPFADGNGRVGRVVESRMLKMAGYSYASTSLAGYYLKNIEDYFALFNVVRIAARKGEPHPNQAFVLFFLKGMLETINENHDWVNNFYAKLLYGSQLRTFLDSKKINIRQYTIVSNLMAKGNIHNLTDIRAEPWYRSLYLDRTRHTMARDLTGLANNQLIEIEGKEIIRLLIP